MTAPTREQVVQWIQQTNVDLNTLALSEDDTHEIMYAMTLARADLEATIAESQDREAKLRETVELLRMYLPNDFFGRKLNRISSSVLAIPSDETALREALAAEREACANVVEGVISRRREAGNTIGFNAMSECMESIRARSEGA